MFKRWKLICEIPDQQFMWAIALLDVNSSFGKSVVAAFPEYFATEEEQGPFPFSVMCRNAEINAAKGSNTGCSWENLVLHGAIEEWMPLFRFGSGVILEQTNFEPIPYELKGASRIGDIWKWGGKELVLVEVALDEAGSEWAFVPAECIDVNR